MKLEIQNRKVPEIENGLKILQISVKDSKSECHLLKLKNNQLK